jgi:hypothetical protein
MPNSFDVCSQQVSIASTEGSIYWTNSRNEACTVSKVTPSQPWPFTQASYNVPANGSTQASLTSGVQPGTYPFQCSCCPTADPSHPRVIIIN